MNCQDAGPFVSALYDRETVPKEVADHIRGCSSCKERLGEYAQIAAELRLLASSASETVPTPLRHLPPRGGGWVRRLTVRVLVPRFAIGLAIVTIVGLSVGLGLMRAQSSGLWFQFDVSDPETQGKVGCLLRAGDPACEPFFSVSSARYIGVQVQALEVQNDAVRLSVRARAFEPEPGGDEAKVASYQAAVVSREIRNRIFANSTPREFHYVPGQTLEIPVEGDHRLLLTGRVFRLRPSFSAEWYRVAPEPDEIVLSKAALVRGNEFLGEVGGSGSAQAGNSALGICVPSIGTFVFALKPFEGAIEGLAEFGQVHFRMDGQDYILFSATPITGGQQPREIWIYRSPNCPRSWHPAKRPLFVGAGDVADVLRFLQE